MNIMQFLEKLLGKKAAMYISILCLGASLAWAIPTYIVTPAALQKEIQTVQEEQEKANAGFQIQLYEMQLTTLTNELYQLKKLKSKKMADEDDVERLDEVKKQIDSIKVKRDSLQNVLIKKRKN